MIKQFTVSYRKTSTFHVFWSSFTCVTIVSYKRLCFTYMWIIVIVKISYRSTAFKIFSTVLNGILWITAKSKEIFSYSPLIGFMEFYVFEEYARNACCINIIACYFKYNHGQENEHQTCQWMVCDHTCKCLHTPIFM